MVSSTFVDIHHGMMADAVRLLQERGVSYRLIRLRERAVSVEDVVRLSESTLNQDEIAKTIIVKDRKGVYHGVLLMGHHRIDAEKLKGVLGKTRIARLNEVEEVTGVKPGAVCPLTLGVPLMVDRRVLEMPRVNFGSGDHLYGIEMDPRDMEKLVELRVVDIVKL